MIAETRFLSEKSNHWLFVSVVQQSQDKNIALGYVSLHQLVILQRSENLANFRSTIISKLKFLPSISFR